MFDGVPLCILAAKAHTSGTRRATEESLDRQEIFEIVLATRIGPVTMLMCYVNLNAMSWTSDVSPFQCEGGFIQSFTDVSVEQ